MAERVKIASSETRQNRGSIAVSVRADGGVRLKGCDSGEIAEAFAGHDDYEYWVDVPPSELPRLVLALLEERYRGNQMAVSEFRSFCEQRGITHEFDTF